MRAGSTAGLEFLPDDEELGERRSENKGLTAPELAILLSYSKITTYQDLLNSDAPEDPFLSQELERYFPAPLRERFSEQLHEHRLHRQITATHVTNSLINRNGPSFVFRLGEETGAAAPDIARAHTAARDLRHAAPVGWHRSSGQHGRSEDTDQNNARRPQARRARDPLAAPLPPPAAGYWGDDPHFSEGSGALRTHPRDPARRRPRSGGECRPAPDRCERTAGRHSGPQPGPDVLRAGYHRRGKLHGRVSRYDRDRLLYPATG